MNTSPGTVGSDPVILATAGYDHTVRFWQAHSGICTRTVQHQDSVSSAGKVGRVGLDRTPGGDGVGRILQQLSRMVEALRAPDSRALPVAILSMHSR